MPLSQSPIVGWPAEYRHLLKNLQIATGPDGTRYGRLDLDVDSEILFGLNDFEVASGTAKFGSDWQNAWLPG
jgi:hypothetical protein